MDYNVTIRIASLSSQVNTNKYYLIDTTFNGIPHSICLYCHIPYLVASWFQRGIKPIKNFKKDTPRICLNREDKIYSYAQWLL